MSRSPEIEPIIADCPDYIIVRGIASIAIREAGHKIHHLAETSSLPESNVIEGQLIFESMADSIGRKLVEVKQPSILVSGLPVKVV